MNFYKATVTDFEKTFCEPLSKKVKDKIKEIDLQYTDLTTEEKDTLILDILKTLDNPTVKKAGPHRINDWIKGWGENNNEFINNPVFSSLVPKYFGKLPYVRWNQKFIKPKTKEFEYGMVKVLQYWLFDKYFSTLNNIYEFGCGTGHNLFRVNEINPQASLYGLDWSDSSLKVIENINKVYDFNIKGHKFDYFNIDNSFNLGKNSGIFTFASLEQVGDKSKDFIQYLINQNPKVCLHIEPMGEYLDQENLNDYLSLKYFEKRNYIKGLRTHLHELEANNQIEILQDQRSYIGSMFVDGYSIIAWRPKIK